MHIKSINNSIEFQHACERSLFFLFVAHHHGDPSDTYAAHSTTSPVRTASSKLTTETSIIHKTLQQSKRTPATRNRIMQNSHQTTYFRENTAL